MSRRLITLAAVLLGCSATIAAAAISPPDASPHPEQDKPGPIRVSIDVVAVDVQVIDREGRPVPDLTPDKFTVTINGKRRRVISAERIATDEGGDVDRAPTSGPVGSVQGRVILIAIDCGSFEATASRDVNQSLRRFVTQLSPDDYLGLSAYPNGAKVDPTRDHSAVLRALDTVVGQRDLADLSQFHVRPSEMIDLTRELYSAGRGPRLDAIAARECGGPPPEPTCLQRLITDVNTTALYYEGQASASLGMLRGLVSGMAGFTGRKTVLLVSGGMIASDTPGGRPDLGDLGILVGKEAAIANAAIYTIFVDSSISQRFSAQTRMGDKSLDNWERDTALLARWLEQFTGAAGGALFRVQTSNADQVLARVRNELALYYLLGVEPADDDRDGRMHEISVKTTEPKVTIRGRRWVTIPIRGATPPKRTPEKTLETTAATLPPASPTPAPRRVVPPDVQALADLFDRNQYDAVQKSLAQSTNLANLIRGFRTADTPWPNDPKRAALFALDLAFAGLRSDNGYARDEGARLLGEYHMRVRQPGNADAFECAWFLTEAAALEGLFLPENAVVFIPAAIQRCPTASRLHLAYAFVSEQQWLRTKLTPAQEAEIVTRYETAMKFPDTEVEARVRAARFVYATGNFDRALELLNSTTTQTSDKELRYFAELIRGQALRARGRSDEAIAAFRAALVAWPGAQSARVALMTLLVTRGDREEAAVLAEASQTGSVDEFDPWWMYWLGDFRAYPTLLEKLRGLAR